MVMNRNGPLGGSVGGLGRDIANLGGPTIMKKHSIVISCLIWALCLSAAPALAEWELIRPSVGQAVLGQDSIENAPLVYATDLATGDIMRLESGLGTWTKIGGPGQKFVVAGSGHLYGLSPDRSGIYRYNGAPMSWTRVRGASGDIFGGPAGFFATDPDTGDLNRLDEVNLTWTRIGGPGLAFAVGDLGHLYGLAPDGGGVWKYDFDQNTWSQIGGPAGAIFAGGQRVFATNPETGVIYGYDSATDSWTDRGGGGLDSQYAVDCTGQIYGWFSYGAQVWRCDNQDDGTPHWSQIGPEAEAIAAGGDSLVYFSPGERNLYLYLKPEASQDQ